MPGIPLIPFFPDSPLGDMPGIPLIEPFAEVPPPGFPVGELAALIPGIASISFRAVSAGVGVGDDGDCVGVGVAGEAIPGIPFMSSCASVPVGHEAITMRRKAVAIAARVIVCFGFIDNRSAFYATDTTRNMPISMW
jgi:hypothetical protein